MWGLSGPATPMKTTEQSSDKALTPRPQKPNTPMIKKISTASPLVQSMNRMNIVTSNEPKIATPRSAMYKTRSVFAARKDFAEICPKSKICSDKVTKIRGADIGTAEVAIDSFKSNSSLGKSPSLPSTKEKNVANTEAQKRRPLFANRKDFFELVPHAKNASGSISAMNAESANNQKGVSKSKTPIERTKVSDEEMARSTGTSKGNIVPVLISGVQKRRSVFANRKDFHQLVPHAKVASNASLVSETNKDYVHVEKDTSSKSKTLAGKTKTPEKESSNSIAGLNDEIQKDVTLTKLSKEKTPGKSQILKSAKIEKAISKEDILPPISDVKGRRSDKSAFADRNDFTSNVGKNMRKLCSNDAVGSAVKASKERKNFVKDKTPDREISKDVLKFNTPKHPFEKSENGNGSSIGSSSVFETKGNTLRTLTPKQNPISKGSQVMCTPKNAVKPTLVFKPASVGPKATPRVIDQSAVAATPVMKSSKLTAGSAGAIKGTPALTRMPTSKRGVKPVLSIKISK